MNKRIQFSLFGQNKYQKEGMHVGVRIDRLVLLSLLAGTLYLFFVGAFLSVPLAAASAFLALALVRKIAGRFPTLRRGTPASRRLEALSLMPRQEAEKAVERALDRAYPGQRGDACLALILRHPAAGGNFAGNAQRKKSVLLYLHSSHHPAQAGADSADRGQPALWHGVSHEPSGGSDGGSAHCPQ